MRSRSLLLAAALIVALPAATAHAGTVDGYGSLFFDAGRGEANAVTVTNTGTELVLRDSVAITFRGGTGCHQPDPHTVACPAAAGHPYVNLRDGDDTFTWEGAGLEKGPNGETLNVSGGQGDDAITGSSAADGLSGEEGADRLDGGDGDDMLNGGADPDRDAVEGGPGDDFISNATDVDAGPGTDRITVDGGGDVKIQDGGQDTLECTAPVASLKADVWSEIGFHDRQDLVRGCHPSGTERGRLRLVSTQRRFRISKRTRTIRLRFACPAETRFVCETPDMSDLYSKACECGYEAQKFRVLPGETLTVPFTPPKHDLQTLLHDLYWKRTLKGGIVWTSVLDDAQTKKEGVWIRFVATERRR